ncbi:MAG: DUF4091 domain-containing protein [Clostridia bacterium]|nr:DUF4091 domain-containing protein [Clostridia bacterium]
MSNVVFTDALHKLFKNDRTPISRTDTLRLFSGERGNVQIVADCEKKAVLTLDCPLPFRLYAVKEVPSAFPISPDAKNCTLVNGGRPGNYPDLLVPVENGAALKKGRTVLWLEVFTDACAPGDYPIVARIDGDADGAASLTATVGKTRLPAQKLIHTNWFHTDCLSTYYGAPVFSDRYWTIVEAFMKNAADHGVNCILTPLFTPPLDTAVGSERPTVQLVGVKKKRGAYEFDFSLLTRWMDLAEACGIKYFELSHLFTQWGARHAPKVIAETAKGTKRIFGWETDSLSKAYRNFLTQFGAALTAFTDARGVTDRCFIHCSDEPGKDCIRRYRACAKIIHTSFSAYSHIDALSDPEYFEQGLVPVPVPGEGRIDLFYGKAKRLWTYYCCGQFNDELPNRFFAMPSIRNRILGVLLYKYGCEGFLQWGFNFYYTQLSLRPVDPFTETDAGGHFPSGDSFVVYPGKDGKPLSSLRQKVFFDGLQDMRALQAAEALSSPEAVRELIGETIGDIDFSRYPMDTAAFRRFRAALFAFCEERSGN